MKMERDLLEIKLLSSMACGIGFTSVAHLTGSSMMAVGAFLYFGLSLIYGFQWAKEGDKDA